MQVFSDQYKLLGFVGRVVSIRVENLQRSQIREDDVV